MSGVDEVAGAAGAQGGVGCNAATGKVGQLMDDRLRCGLPHGCGQRPGLERVGQDRMGA